jgi:hypothetical protein
MPIMGSTLSVKASVTSMYNRPEVPEASLMPERETEVKRSSTTSSPTKADLIQPLPHATASVVVQKVCIKAPKQAESCRQSVMCIGALASLILSSSAQESPLVEHGRAYSRKKPKEPDKAPGIQLREPLLSNPREARSFARLSVGSTPQVRPIPSASPPSDRDKWPSPIRIISKTNKTRASWDLPRPRAALTLPNDLPACPSQAPSTFPSRKVVPRQRDTKTVVSKSNGPNISRLSPIFKRHISAHVAKDAKDRP